MISHLFLGVSLVGAEWVLILLLLVSICSLTLIGERWFFYRQATRDLDAFRSQIQAQVHQKKLVSALKTAQTRFQTQSITTPDLETGLALALLEKFQDPSKHACSVDVLTELAQYEVIRARVKWEQNLSLLATIGSNAPFVGLFGTVLGIIKAFHDLSQQTASAGAQTVTAGISEALIATAVGILVAIPAVVAFNLFQRRVKKAASEAEALKCFLLGTLAEKR
jgi:biopolymer transport protein ExbB/TolQ